MNRFFIFIFCAAFLGLIFWLAHKGKAFLIPIVAMIGLIAMFGSIWFMRDARFLNLPEQSAHVQVVDQRYARERVGTGSSGGISTHFFVTFEFSDGSLKELFVGASNNGRRIYESFNIGESGILVYREVAGATGVRENFWPADAIRQFISFEKDEVYGGLLIEDRSLPYGTWMLIIGAPIVLGLGVLSVILTVKHFKKKGEEDEIAVDK